MMALSADDEGKTSRFSVDSLDITFKVAGLSDATHKLTRQNIKAPKCFFSTFFFLLNISLWKIFPFKIFLNFLLRTEIAQKKIIG